MQGKVVQYKCNTVQGVNYNWREKQILSTGVGLKTRGGRGGGRASLRLAWQVCGRAVLRGLQVQCLSNAFGFNPFAHFLQCGVTDRAGAAGHRSH